MRLTRTFAAMLMALAGGAAQPAAADNSPPDFRIDLPAGLACPGFDLRIEAWYNPNRVQKIFTQGTDTSGKPVRMLDAGKGSTLLFTNLANGRLYWVQPNGSVDHVTFNPDGSSTWVTTGHYVIVFFPTDSFLANGAPAGPSTRQYVGQVVFFNDVDGTSTVQKISGRWNDICAALQ